MKRKMARLMGVMVMAAALGAAAPQGYPGMDYASVEAASVTKAEAKKLALTDSGVTEKAAEDVRVKTKTGKYEIDIRTSRYEYDYTVMKNTGKIREKDFEIIEWDEGDQNQSGSVIGEDSAKKKAYKAVGADSSKVKSVSVEKDTDDGWTVYEVKFKVGKSKYEVTVDAYDGTVLSYEIDFR